MDFLAVSFVVDEELYNDARLLFAYLNGADSNTGLLLITSSSRIGRRLFFQLCHLSVSRITQKVTDRFGQSISK